MQKSATLLAFISLGGIALGYPTPQTGTLIYEPSEVAPGNVLFTGQDGVVYLVDAGGQIVWTWTSPDPERQPKLGHVKPLPGGRILSFMTGGPTPGCGFNCGDVLVELDPEGEPLWVYEDPERLLHHDFERLSGGRTLILCSREIERPEISPLPLTDDCLIEVDSSGTVVWEWQAADHFDEFGFSQEAKDLIAAAGGDWAHANSVQSIPSNTPHTDPRFRPGNIVVSFRQLNRVVVIDRATDEIVWQFDQAIGQHDAEMLTNDLHGAGNVLMLDNGGAAGYPERFREFSRLVEVDPVTGTIVYRYTAFSSGRPDWTFFTHFIGSVQRLRNGNQLVGEGATGRFFEITPSGEIVWEFVSPVFDEFRGRGSTNQVYRALKVPLDWLPSAARLDR